SVFSCPDDANCLSWALVYGPNSRFDFTMNQVEDIFWLLIGHEQRLQKTSLAETWDVSGGGLGIAKPLALPSPVRRVAAGWHGFRLCHATWSWAVESRHGVGPRSVAGLHWGPTPIASLEEDGHASSRARPGAPSHLESLS